MTGDNHETSLKGMLQGMIPRDAELLQGIVTSVSPLRIQIVNDSKLIVSSISAVVPQHLKDHTVTVTINGGSNAEMTVHNALKTGDRVHLLALQRGKKYYVLDRV